MYIQATINHVNRALQIIPQLTRSDPLPDLVQSVLTALGFGLALVSVISSDAVEKSLILDNIDSLSNDERPEGGRRRIYFMLLSVDDLLEVCLDDSELPPYSFFLIPG